MIILAGTILVYAGCIIGFFAMIAAASDRGNPEPGYVIGACLAAIIIGGMMGVR